MSENQILSPQQIATRGRLGSRDRINDLLERNRAREIKRAAKAAQKEKEKQDAENIKSDGTGQSEDQPDRGPTPKQKQTEYGQSFITKVADQHRFFLGKFKKVEEAFAFLMERVSTLENYVNELTKAYEDGKKIHTGGGKSNSVVGVTPGTGNDKQTPSDAPNAGKKKGQSTQKSKVRSGVVNKKLEDRFPPQRLPVGDPKLDIMSGARSKKALDADKSLGSNKPKLQKT